MPEGETHPRRDIQLRSPVIASSIEVPYNSANVVKFSKNGIFGTKQEGKNISQ
jgi:hypothetical protein